MQADWESNHYLFLSRYTHFFKRLKSEKKEYLFRVGRILNRPSFSGLNSWFVLQLKYKESFELTPLLRSYYKNILLEFGYSTNKNILLSFILRLS